MLAVTATNSSRLSCFLRSRDIMARRRRDFPVQVGLAYSPVHSSRNSVRSPADPVKNTLFSSSTTICKTWFYSSFNLATDVVWSGPHVVLRDTRGVKNVWILDCFADFDASNASPDLRFFEIDVIGCSNSFSESEWSRWGKRAKQHDNNMITCN